jgi:hypothetical protein
MEYLQTFLKSTSIGGPHGDHCVYWIPIKIFNQLPIRRWKFNRPPDKDRVAEIHEHMKHTQRMDGIVYLAFVEGELVCYESNHRREALRGLDELADVLVDIIWNATDDLVKSEFVRLNKAISVPELYIQSSTDIHFDSIRKAVDDFCVTYKSHKSTANNPQRPNFNRDKLTDEFYRIIKEHGVTLDVLVQKLTDHNKRLSLMDHSKLPTKIVEKCSRSGLWLFAISSVLNEKDFL